MKSRVAGCLIALLLAASFASAQEQRGLITGTVFDAQGAVVPGAAVTVTDEGTGAVYNGKTTGEGTFTIPGLPSGSYSVVIVAPGFSKWTTTKVQVVTAQEANMKAILQVGTSAETVTV